MKERKIGEVIKVIVTEGLGVSDCRSCCLDGDCTGQYGECQAELREDGKDVYFVEVE
jgi:hypothetical protein